MSNEIPDYAAKDPEHIIRIRTSLETNLEIAEKILYSNANPTTVPELVLNIQKISIMLKKCLSRK